MNNIEEVRKIREQQLQLRNKRKELELQVKKDNELRNKAFAEIEELRNKWISAVRKDAKGLELSPQEKEFANADILEMSYRVTNRFLDDIEQLGLYPYNENKYCIRDGEFKIETTLKTKLFFTKKDRELYDEHVKLEKNNLRSKIKAYNQLENNERGNKTINDDVKEDKYNNKDNNIKTIQYSNKNGEESLKVNGEEKDIKELYILWKDLLGEL